MPRKKKAVKKQEAAVVETPVLSQEQFDRLSKASSVAFDVRNILDDIRDDSDKLNVRQIGFIVGKAYAAAEELENIIDGLKVELDPDPIVWDDDDSDEDSSDDDN